MADLIVRGGTVVTGSGPARVDISIDSGVITAIGPELEGAPEVIDASGMVILPGVIDVHVHFNEPGRSSWEGAESGSRALAAGGGTLFFDMPLNSTPCTVGPHDFDRKRAALEAASIADFGLWGGLIPGRVSEMAEMAERGVVGFKAFMCDSGLPEFPRADDGTLYEGLVEAAHLGLPVAVHAESEELTRAFAREVQDGGASAFLRSRPVLAETEAVQRVLLLAREAGAKLHLVHLSCGGSVAMAAEARASGVDVSIETCPHYLFFTDGDLEQLGTIGKCAPPLRSPADQSALWSDLLSGHVDIVASDHSPTEPALKPVDFRRAWGGIAGVQSMLSVLLSGGRAGEAGADSSSGRRENRVLSLERIASLVSGGPAKRFQIARRGVLTVGYHADLALVDPAASFTLESGHLYQRHKVSPYVGHTFRGRVRRTIRRGETIFLDGRVCARSRGVLVRPERT